MNKTNELIRIEQVTHRFGQTLAVDNVSLTIRENEFFALLGPSGCGKTTLLRMLAGFVTPDSGRLMLDGKDLVGVKPYRRPVNMMFQSYALFPHMTVYDNVAYGLRQERIAKAEVARRSAEVLEMVGLGGLAQRKPDTLSGGQRQRVALARAVVKRPRVLLLDEPLTALDRKLRVEMRLELKRLQQEVGITFLFVTHDQEEALVMSDRAAIMNAGRILQVGTVEELYESPNSLFVANFMGESNVFKGKLQVVGEEVALVGNDRTWRVARDAHRRANLANGDSAAIVVRPERLRVESAESAPLGGEIGNTMEAVLADLVYLGSTLEYLIELRDGTRLTGRVQVGQQSETLSVGTAVRVSWNIQHGILVADSPGAESLA